MGMTWSEKPSEKGTLELGVHPYLFLTLTPGG